MVVFTFLLFTLLVFFSFYIPGRIFLRIVKIQQDFYAQTILSWVTGIALFILLSYVGAMLTVPYLTIVVLIGCSIYYLYTKPRLPNIKDQKIDYWQLAIVLLGSFSILSLMFFSGWYGEKGLQFIGHITHDNLVHFAYITNQANTFPPQHPGLAEVPLRGYHFFYDFLLSRFVLFYQFSATDLYFRLFPLLLGLLLGGSVLLFTKDLTKNVITQRFVLFLTYFAQSTLSPLLLFYNNPHLLGILQPLSLIADPSVVLGIILLVTSFSLIPKIKEHVAYAVIVGLLLGILAQIKVYTGVVGILSLGVYCIYLFFKERKKYFFHYILAVIITSIVTAFTFLLNNFGYGSLVFWPLLFYEHYMQTEIMRNTHWEIRRAIFAEHHNIPRLILLYVEGIFLTWFANLGARMIILVYFYKIFKKKFWQNSYHVILFFGVVSSMLLPSLFVQSRSLFDVIQFIWITLLLLCIPAGILWGELFQKFNKFGKAIIILFLAAFSLIGYTVTKNIFTSEVHPHIISYADLNFYSQVTAIVPENAFIIYLPKNKVSEPTRAALIKRAMYYEGEITPYVQPSLLTERKKNLEKLQALSKVCKGEQIYNHVKKIGSPYIVTDTPNTCFKKLSKNHVASSTFNLYLLSY